MNIFLLGLNLSEDKLCKISSLGKEITGIYPLLNEQNNYTYTDIINRISLKLIFSDKVQRGKREYFAENDEYILFYSGIGIDPSGRRNAHEAKVLLDNFDELKYDLDGQVSLVRINKLNHEVDIITDCLGMEQVYYSNLNGNFLISNSVEFISSITNCYDLDPLGISYFLSFGWVASDRTLRINIRTIGGGQHWRYNCNNETINKITYFDPLSIKIDTRKALSKDSLQKLTDHFTNDYNKLDENFKLECPLTGGFDSRLVAAILIKNKINTDFYTIGNPEHREIKIASQIAKEFNLPYKVYPIPIEYAIDNWEKLVKDFIMQADGMVSLWQLVDIFSNSGETSDIHVRLGTAGSEIGRWAYNRPNLMEKSIHKEDVFDYLSGRLLYNYEEILTDEAIGNHTELLTEFFRQSVEKGFNFKILPDLFFTLQRVGKHKANNLRKIRSVADSFSIFTTKEYIKTAMSLDPLNKTIYPIHYKIIKTLNKDLHKIPFLKEKWPIQNTVLKLFFDRTKEEIKKRVKFIDKIKKEVNLKKENPVVLFDRERLFRAKRKQIISVCLDQSSSEIWRFIDRKKIENILFEKEGYKIQNKGLEQLYTIVTLFYYQLLTTKRFMIFFIAGYILYG